MYINRRVRSRARDTLLAAVSVLVLASPAPAAQVALTPVPLFLASTVPPNVLVVLDNSQSMDGQMNGLMVSGNAPQTRSNVGRRVIRSVIGSWRSSFRWGLMSFGLRNSAVYNIYGYYMGSDTELVPTSDCTSINGLPVDAVNPGRSSNGLRCIPNPQAFSGAGFVTFSKTGDDPDVNDVLYTTGVFTSLWGIAATTGAATAYRMFTTKLGNLDFSAGGFSGGLGTWDFTPTDAGFLPTRPRYTRQVYVPRGWGYYGDVTGAGTLDRAIQNDTDAHYNALMALLAPETNTASTEIKNAAVFTPLVGTLTSARAYFEGTAGNTSPVQYSCQQNFVALLTDGLPTGTATGTLYSTAERALTPDGTGAFTMGRAFTDTLSAVTALRSATTSFGPRDIKTYVVALGDTVANPGAVWFMNRAAAAGGTSAAYLATSEDGVQAAFRDIAIDISRQTSAASAVALSTGSASANSRMYQARFSSANWSGQLLAYPLGTDGAIGTPLWDAASRLTGQHFDHGRSIITWNPTRRTGVAFRWPANPAAPTTSELDTSQIGALDTLRGVNDGQGSARLAWLRGSRADEGISLRARPGGVLGDIIDSAPTYVAGPGSGYPDSIATSPYSSFVTARAGRPAMVYVGANDGMLHGFDAATGDERIAYVPSFVYPRLAALTSTTYAHQYYVNGTPAVADAFIRGAWRTVLVGGTAQGGQGFFALDVSTPESFSEAVAADTVLWEFSDRDDTRDNDPDRDGSVAHALGYSFSRPVIAKMNNGRWAAIVGNGFNNTEADGAASTTGYAVLYVLDLETGLPLKKISTFTGTSDTPNALTSVTAVDHDGNGTADTLYAGDLQGNVWKFDVTSSDTGRWAPAFGAGAAPLPLFTAVDERGNRQPVTAPVEVGYHPLNGVLVFVGTGKYLEHADLGATSGQSVYGLWDRGQRLESPALMVQTVTGTGTLGGERYRTVTAHAISRSAWNGTDGWRIDLPDSGERVVARPTLRSGRLVVVTITPSNEPCSHGGTSWLMELDADTGGAPLAPVFDTNRDRVINSADNLGTLIPAGLRIPAIASAPAILPPPRGATTESKYLNLSSGSVQQVLESVPGRRGPRLSWEELRR